MNSCENLYYLSTIACKMAECLDTIALEILAEDLQALGTMFATIAARRSSCSQDDESAALKQP